MSREEWWDEPGMEEEIDAAAWVLHRGAEVLPSRWKHIISAASALVLCANRKDGVGVQQYMKEISGNLPNIKEKGMELGKHLATYSVFRESDGSLHLTVMEASGVRRELHPDTKDLPLYPFAIQVLYEAVEQKRKRDIIT